MRRAPAGRKGHASKYAGFAQDHGWSYPSLPDYTELPAGSTLGFHSDCAPGFLSGPAGDAGSRRPGQAASWSRGRAGVGGWVVLVQGVQGSGAGFNEGLVG